MKLKSILLIAILVLFITGAQAQDKHEFGTVFYNAMGGKAYKITISLASEPVIVIEGKYTDYAMYENFSAANKVLGELNEKGWEVYSTTTNAGVGHFYYLRKKK